MQSSTAINDEFFEFALNKSVIDENSLHKNKSKFLKVRTTAGSRNPIEEILSNPDIMTRLTDVKVIDQVRCRPCRIRILTLLLGSNSKTIY